MKIDLRKCYSYLKGYVNIYSDPSTYSALKGTSVGLFERFFCLFVNSRLKYESKDLEMFISTPFNIFSVDILLFVIRLR